MARKITSKTDNKGWTDPSKKKVRKKRKPMTEEQKTAAAERLERKPVLFVLLRTPTMV